MNTITADGIVVKVSSNRSDPADAVRRALAGRPDTTSVDVLAHGTTVATNADRKSTRLNSSHT